MATPTINLTGRIPLFGGTAATLDVKADPQVLSKPFPHAPLDVATVGLSGSDPIALSGSGGAKVSLNFAAGANAGVGVVLDGAALATLLSLDQDLSLPDVIAGAAIHYAVLRCGFDVKASANGSVGLGVGGSVTFGVNASADATYAVVQGRSDGAMTALAEVDALAGQIRLPANVVDESSLAPGTWIVTEVDGSLGVTLGVQYGLTYNWIKQLTSGAFAGDFGLQLQLGLSASLGLSVSGSYVLVISRASAAQSVLRLRVFRRSQRGSSLAFNAGVDVQPKVSLPTSPDDFVKAVFGVQGQQIVKDLEVLATWNGQSGSLAGFLAAAGVDRVVKLLTDATGVDASTALSAAQAKLKSFLDVWNNLGSDASATLLSLVASSADLSKVKDAATLIASGSRDGFASFLSSELKDVGFFQTPLGQYLESLATDGIVSLLDAPAFTGLKSLAQNTLSLLDGADVQNVLTNIQKKVVSALDLQPLLDLAGKFDQTTFDGLDSLLKAKLADFVEKAIPSIVADDVARVAKVVNTILQKAGEIYAAAKDALNHDYKFNLAATYQAQTTSTALLDVNFDFGVGDRATLSALLAGAIQGRLDFDAILAKSVAGLSLNTARLTHDIKRQTQVELNMPYFSASSNVLLESTAGMSAVDTQDGRLYVYDLRAQAQQDASVAGRYHRNSTLTVLANVSVPSTSIRTFSADTLSYTYTFTQASQGLGLAAFDTQVSAYLDAYCRPVLAANRVTAKQWLSAIELKADPNRLPMLGNCWISLALDVPGTTTAAWLSSAGARDAQVRAAVFGAVQALVPFFYFLDLSRFGDLDSAAALLLFSAADLTTLELGNPTAGTAAQAGAAAQVGGDTSPLGRILASCSNALALGAGPKQAFYQNTAINRQTLVTTVTTTDALALFSSLLIGTAQMADSVASARASLAAFAGAGPMSPTDGVKALSRFGEQLVSAFSKLPTLYGGSAINPLATLVFTETSRALTGRPVSVNALLDVAVLSAGVNALNLPQTGPVASQVLSGSNLLATGVPAQLPVVL